MAFVHVRMSYLERLGNMSYPTTKPVPVFLNMDILNPIGSCQLVFTDDDEGNDLFYGFMWLAGDIDMNLYFYYLREADDKECFSFKAINLSTKKMYYARQQKKVLQMLVYRAAIHRHPKTLRDMQVGKRV